MVKAGEGTRGARWRTARGCGEIPTESPHERADDRRLPRWGSVGGHAGGVGPPASRRYSAVFARKADGRVRRRALFRPLARRGWARIRRTPKRSVALPLLADAPPPHPCRSGRDLEYAVGLEGTAPHSGCPAVACGEACGCGWPWESITRRRPVLVFV